MLPSTLDMASSPSTWNPRPSTLDKKIDPFHPPPALDPPLKTHLALIINSYPKI